MREEDTTDAGTLAVSVIVPVYDGACYVADAITSVVRQSHHAHEIIVIDDGSRDDSAAVIASFGDRVRSHRQENAGTGTARNRGVARARGALLAFLDQDDIWEDDKLARQVEALAADPSLDAVFCMVTYFHSPEMPEDLRARVPCPAAPRAGYLPTAMLVRREAFVRVGPFAEGWRLVEWTDWFVRAVDTGLRMRLLPDVLARRRLHAGNKGLALREFRGEYSHVFKALLDRRRRARMRSGA